MSSTNCGMGERHPVTKHIFAAVKKIAMTSSWSGVHGGIFSRPVAAAAGDGGRCTGAICILRTASMSASASTTAAGRFGRQMMRRLSWGLDASPLCFHAKTSLMGSRMRSTALHFKESTPQSGLTRQKRRISSKASWYLWHQIRAIFTSTLIVNVLVAKLVSVDEVQRVAGVARAHIYSAFVEPQGLVDRAIIFD